VNDEKGTPGSGSRRQPADTAAPGGFALGHQAGSTDAKETSVVRGALSGQDGAGGDGRT
jgi:hypothetical protein